MYTLKRICVWITKTVLLLVELFHHCASKPIKTTRTGGNSNFFLYDSGNKRCCTIPAAATMYKDKAEWFYPH